MKKSIVFFRAYFYIMKSYYILHNCGFGEMKKWVNSITFKRNDCDNEYLQFGYMKALKYSFLNVNCLERSVALLALMKYYGISSELCIGVGKKIQTFHAWILNDQIPELDESDYSEEYVIVSTIKVSSIS